MTSEYPENLTILFVGFNPSITSSISGHHYASPNNRFWKILFLAGITDRQYRSDEGEQLLEQGFGFTNIVARPTKSATEITKEEYKIGREILKAKIKKYKPKIVCYVGKGVFQQFSGKRNVHWGLQKEETITGVSDFVAPSSSGLVRMKLDEIVEIYRQLPNIM